MSTNPILTITMMLAQHRCVPPGITFNWSHFIQSNKYYRKDEILSFLVVYHTCQNSKCKYLFLIFKKFPTVFLCSICDKAASRSSLNPIKLDYPLRTLHHNLIEVVHFFAAMVLKLLSNYAKCAVLGRV